MPVTLAARVPVKHSVAACVVEIFRRVKVNLVLTGHNGAEH